MIHKLQFSLMLALFITISGCNAFRPSVEKQSVVTHAGNPMQVLSAPKDIKAGKPLVVTGQTFVGNNVIDQDISGWFAMPYDHWMTIKAQLDKDKADGRLIVPPLAPPAATPPKPVSQKQIENFILGQYVRLEK